MPRDIFTPGTGPQGLHRPLIITVQAPSSLSADTPIKQGQPLKWARVSEDTGSASTVGLGRQAALCAEDDVPELISEMRCEVPYAPLSVAVLPIAPYRNGVAGRFVTKVPITGTPDTGTDLSVVADGDYGFKVVENANASLASGVVGNNNAITWTAREPGADGNDITVAITNPGGTVAAPVVTVTGTAISVAAGTDTGNIDSTATEIIAAVQAHAAANSLVSVANTSTSNGSGVVVAFSADNLEGGAMGIGAVISIEGDEAELLV